MELRSVEELMDLLYACRSRHALRTAALLRRSRPADKELQLAGLVHDIGRLLCPGDESRGAEHAAAAVRSLLGERVYRLVRRDGRAREDDLTRLILADEESRTAGFDAGVLEDWRTVLELVAARNSRLGAVD
ncbi:inositol oxygenase family protein [Streptomyces sp. SLBN-31]|uniref:inositol oxygenase family protein n=1 Tax=Streptomyces sp. SLBN-31 TaxID=2768444 RepID=UPI0011529DC9|nr:inositol oxygenase family protein [Streptomyces sp. SLBN-31]TQJ91557.1 myo-inositol oxygenase [Streptomyces sp. SLBN-31]